MSQLNSDSQMNSAVQSKKKKKNKHQRKSIGDDGHADKDSFLMLVGVEKNWRQECENFAQKETFSGSSQGLLSESINTDLISQKSLFELNSSSEGSPRKKKKQKSGSKSISHQQLNDEVKLEQALEHIRGNDFLSCDELEGHNKAQKIRKIKSRSESISLTDSEMNQSMSASVVTADNSENERKKKKKKSGLEIERTDSDSIQTSLLTINKVHNECSTDASKLRAVGFTILDNLSVNLKNIAEIVSSTTESHPANKSMNFTSKNPSKQNFEQEPPISSSSLSLPISSQKKHKKEKLQLLERQTMNSLNESILSGSDLEKDENDEIQSPESLAFSESNSAKKKKKKNDKSFNHGADESINSVESPVFHSMSEPLSCKSQKKRKRVISESSNFAEEADNVLAKKRKFSDDDSISMTVNYNSSPEKRFHKKHEVKSPVLEIFSDDGLQEVPDQQRSAKKKEKSSISSVTITQRISSPPKNHLTLNTESQTELNDSKRQSDRYDFKLEQESSSESSDELPCGSMSSTYHSALESQTNSQPDQPRPGTSGYSRRMVPGFSSSPEYFTAKSLRYADSEVENSSEEENENNAVNTEYLGNTEHPTVVEVFNISDDESREIEPGEVLSPKRKKKSNSNNAKNKTTSNQTRTMEVSTIKPERIIIAEPVEFHDRNTISQQYWKDVYNSLDEKGISYNTGKWSFDEIEQLKYNWENIVKDCPFEEPHRLLAKKMSDLDNMEIRKLTKYIEETKLYIQLGYGIRRSLYVIYLRARTLFIPGNRLGRFTEEDTDTFTTVLNNRFNLKAAAEIVGRTRQAARDKWRCLKPGIKKGPWSKEEDDQLQAIIAEYLGKTNGTTDDEIPYELPWKELAERMPTRNFKQCRNHWILRKREKFKDKQLPKVKSKYLVQAIVNQNVNRESDINWIEVQEQLGKEYYPQYYQGRFTRIVWKVLGKGEKRPFQETMQLLMEKYPAGDEYDF